MSETLVTTTECWTLLSGWSYRLIEGEVHVCTLVHDHAHPYDGDPNGPDGAWVGEHTKDERCPDPRCPNKYPPMYCDWPGHTKDECPRCGSDGTEMPIYLCSDPWHTKATKDETPAKEAP